MQTLMPETRDELKNRFLDLLIARVEYLTNLLTSSAEPTTAYDVISRPWQNTPSDKTNDQRAPEQQVKRKPAFSDNPRFPAEKPSSSLPEEPTPKKTIPLVAPKPLF